MLCGERVRLRCPERADLPTYVKWFNDPEVRSCLAQVGPLSMAQEERWFENLLNRSNDYLFAIDAAIDGDWRLIGNCGLHRIHQVFRHAVFKIVLGEKDRWGQGYGTAATRLMLGFAFGDLNLHRVQLEVFDFNHRARRCYEKAGFQFEGTQREHAFIDGRYVDVHVMGILAAEFLEQNPD